MFTAFESETYLQYVERLLASQTENEVADWYECAMALLRQVQDRQQYPHPQNNKQTA